VVAFKGDDGWVTVIFGHPELQVLVKIAEVDGLPQVEALRVEPLIETMVRGRTAFSFLGLPGPDPKRVAITSRLLRALPLGAVREAALLQPPVSATLGPVGPPSQGPQPVPLAKLEQVAAIYRDAVDHGSRKPLSAIGEALRVKRSTAAKYVRLARERGLMGWPARGGGAGYSEPESRSVMRDRLLETWAREHE
jgi:hypothetical protein